MISPILITAPTVDPLSLSEIKDHLLITTSDYDTKLAMYADAARDDFERLTNRTLFQTTWELRLDCTPGGPIHFPRGAPLIDVVSFKYLDSEGVENTWDPSLYVVEAAGEMELGRLAPAHGESYPTFEPYPLSPIRIQYRAGIANSLSPQGEVSGAVKECILLMIGEMYEHLEGTVVSERSAANAFSQNPRLPAMISRLRASYGF